MGRGADSSGPFELGGEIIRIVPEGVVDDGAPLRAQMEELLRTAEVAVGRLDTFPHLILSAMIETPRGRKLLQTADPQLSDLRDRLLDLLVSAETINGLCSEISGVHKLLEAAARIVGLESMFTSRLVIISGVGHFRDSLADEQVFCGEPIPRHLRRVLQPMSTAARERYAGCDGCLDRAEEHLALNGLSWMEAKRLMTEGLYTALMPSLRSTVRTAGTIAEARASLYEAACTQLPEQTITALYALDPGTRFANLFYPAAGQRTERSALLFDSLHDQLFVEGGHVVTAFWPTEMQPDMVEALRPLLERWRYSKLRESDAQLLFACAVANRLWPEAYARFYADEDARAFVALVAPTLPNRINLLRPVH